MTCASTRLPENLDYQSTMNFLIHRQFPVILDQSIQFFSMLPKVGVYTRQLREGIMDYKEAILSSTTQQSTLSGIGSLFDYDRFGNQVKRPTPQLYGTGCNGNSLCLESTCYGFTEGIVEANNVMQSMCWELQMNCLKDYQYSDRKFTEMMNMYFKTFFKQAPAVLEAYIRTRLLRDSIKVVATKEHQRFVSTPTSARAIPLPFWFNPADPTAFPDLDVIPSDVGAVNLSAFMEYVAPRIFSGSFREGMQDVTVYGLPQDFTTALRQTASAQASNDYMEIIKMLAARNQSSGDLMMDQLLNNKVIDNLFPTFDAQTGTNILIPITKEILMPSTIAGYIQRDNPEHSLSQYRGLLFVPANYMYTLVSPANDNFSNLGLGEALNFGMNTPGVFPILSSSMFSRNTIGSTGEVIIGQRPSANGMLQMVADGIVSRDRVIQEAVRTEVLLNYYPSSCENAIDGQLPNVGRKIVSQRRASGFNVHSEMNVKTDVMGEAKPVLLLFKADTPLSALPIEICEVNDIQLSQTGGYSIVDCCPGGQIYAVLTFNKDVSSFFSVGNSAVYRTGATGKSYLVTVTAVAGAVVTIATVDQQTTIDCCSGSPDDYGTRGELIVTTGATAVSGVIMKAECDPDNDHVALELFTPLGASLLGATGTITLQNGQIIAVVTTANASGVFVTVEAAPGESCSLCDLPCSCLVNAIFVLTGAPA